MKQAATPTSSVIARRGLLCGGAAALSLVAAPAIIGKARAATPTLKLASVEANDPKFGVGRHYLDLIQKHLKDNGAASDVAIQFYPDSQLGSELDVINQMKLGVVDMMVTSFTSWSNLVPELGIFDLGYVFRDFGHETRALEDPTARKWLDAMLLKAGAHVPACGYYPPRCFETTFAFTTPADLAGKKIRCITSPMMTELVNTMGASATPIAFGEVYTALGSGVLDGLETSANAYLGAKLYETAKHYVRTNHVLNPAAVFVGDVTLKRLSSRARDGLVDAIVKATADERAWIPDSLNEMIALLTERGVVASDPDREAFRARAEPLAEKFVQRYPDSKPMFDALNTTRA